MNQSATTSSDPNSQAADPSEVIRLKCPSCNGGLNLQRRHLGVSGNCVHCQSPVRALIRPNGEFFAEIPGNENQANALHGPPSFAPPTSAPQAQQSEVTPQPQPDAQIPAADSSFSRFPPESTPAIIEENPAPVPAQPPAATTPPASDTTSNANSPWGFPKPIDSEPANQGVSSPVEQPPVSVPPAMEQPTAPMENNSAATIEEAPVIPEVPVTSKADTAFGMPVKDESATPPVLDEASPPAAASPFPVATPGPESTPPSFPVGEEGSASPNPPPTPEPEEVSEKKTTPPLFAQSSNRPPKSSMFDTGEDTVDDTPAATHTANGPWAKTDGSSPFSQAAAEENPSPGFAETLFKQEQAVESAQEGKTGEEAPQAGPGFGPPTKESDKSAPEEEKAPVAKKKPSKIFKNGSLSGASAAITKVMRAVIVLTLLAGFGYAGFVLTPPEKVAEMKVKIKEWLKPGEVLNDYLPFKLIPTDEDDAMEQSEATPAPVSEPVGQITTPPETQVKSEPAPAVPPAPQEEKPASGEETPSATPNSPTTPDPAKRPAPAVSADQIAGDAQPPE